MTGSRTAQRRSHAALVNTGIVIWGVISPGAVLFAYPLGLALSVANGVLAVVSRGTRRKLFSAFAIAGVVLCAAIALTLLTARF